MCSSAQSWSTVSNALSGGGSACRCAARRRRAAAVSRLMLSAVILGMVNVLLSGSGDTGPGWLGGALAPGPGALVGALRVNTGGAWRLAAGLVADEGGVGAAGPQGTCRAAGGMAVLVPGDPGEQVADGRVWRHHGGQDDQQCPPVGVGERAEELAGRVAAFVVDPDHQVGGDGYEPFGQLAGCLLAVRCQSLGHAETPPESGHTSGAGRARERACAGVRPGLIDGWSGPRLWLGAGDPPAVMGHDPAAAEQGVDGFVGFAEVGGDGADAGQGVPQLPGQLAEGLQGVLAGGDPGLGIGDRVLGGGDRGGPGAVASLAGFGDGHGAGGGQGVFGRVEASAGGLAGGAGLAGELPGGMQAFGDVVFGGGQVAEELPFVAGAGVLAGGVDAEAAGAEREGCADQPAEPVRVQAGA